MICVRQGSGLFGTPEQAWHLLYCSAHLHMLTADLLSDTVALVCQEVRITALNLQGHKVDCSAHIEPSTSTLSYRPTLMGGT